MRYLLSVLLALLLATGVVLVAQEKQPPTQLKFASKTGDVAFDHAAHVKREKAQCTTCHDKLWPQSATAPLNFKLGLHKPAEAKKTSCGTCHHAGGPAFASAANCKKCHAMGGGAKKD
jgi:c(7)-type cytochrome triheme protein